MSDNPGLDAIIQKQIASALSNTDSLPDDFLSFLPEYVAQNTVKAVSRTPVQLASVWSDNAAVVSGSLAKPLGRRH